MPLLCAAALCAACSPEAELRVQWVLAVATDANVPAFADRLLIEVGDCAASSTGCTSSARELRAGAPSVWPVSFGVAPQGAADTTLVRVRLYRSDRTIGGVPEAGWTIDATVLLPAVDEPSDVSLVMDMRCAGIPSDPQAKTTCDPATRAQAPSPTLAAGQAPSKLPKPGSWASAPCTVEAPEGMVCLPGAGFVMGDRGVISDLSSAEYTSTPERLVTLSPFFLDVDELSVKQMRDLVNAGLVPSEPSVTSGGTFREACTYVGAQEDGSDAFPINCVDHELAAAACEALGKRLPTEAELEYAAGNGIAETPYPWGYDRNACVLATVDVGANCRLDPDGDPWGPVAGGSESDVTSAGVRNLAGNVAEWAADVSAANTDPCWSQLPVPAHNPLCTEGGLAYPDEHGVRGGSWLGVASTARTATRYTWIDSYPADWVGFRCAQPHP